ncbi:MAG TPA: hypothetical protein PKI82_13345, partial [Ruminococcus flavefaciens]|nr:hypothetical protein [Ruminococcus flavefaciens]
DRFRHKITGEVSEVISLTGALPFYSDDCTIQRESSGFAVTENGPNITYKYEITSATGNKTITTYAQGDLDANGNPKADATPITITVNAGIIGAVSTSVGDKASTTDIKEGTITFGADNTNKKGTNKESAATIDLTKKVSKDLTITVDANKIYDPEYGNDGHTNTQVNGPGVYRYMITDKTTVAEYTAAGVTDGGAANDLYLDVYTRYTYDNDGKPNGLEVYGYVLMTANESIQYDGATTEGNKVTGYDTGSENKDTDNTGDIEPAELKSDSYHTYNVEVKKEVKGDLADRTNNFPFKVELTNTNVVSSLDDFYYVIKKDGTALTEQTSYLSDSGSWTLDGAAAATNLQLQAGDSILITGLPVNTKIKVTETNNTDETYTVSAKNTNNGEISFESSPSSVNSLAVAANESAVMATEFAVANTLKKDTITFTNELKSMSVTGIAFTAAPFALMLLAGTFFVGMFMKNRKKDENENVI